MFTNNISFTPIRQSEATELLETPDEIFNRGLYYYANQDREKNLIDKDEDILDRERPYKDKAADIFGTNYIPFNDVTNRNYFLGNALIARKGFANNPYGYAMQHEPDLVKTGKSAEEILSAVGGKEIERQRKIYDDRIAKQQAIEARQREAEKAQAKMTENLNRLLTTKAHVIENALRADDITDINSWNEIANEVPGLDQRAVAKAVQRASLAFSLISEEKRTHITRRDMAYLVNFLGDWHEEDGKKVYEQDALATAFFKAALASKTQRYAADTGFWDSALNALLAPGKGLAQLLDEYTPFYDWFTSNESSLDKDALILRDDEKYRQYMVDMQNTLNQNNAASTQALDDASFLQKTSSFVGSAAGSTVNFFSGAFGAGVFLAGNTNLNRVAAEAEGAENPWLEGSIDAGIDFAVEKIAYGAVGKFSGLSKIADMAIRKFGVSKVTPALLARIQANAIGRGVLNVGAGTAEELILETGAGEVLQGGVRGALNALDVNVEKYTYTYTDLEGVQRTTDNALFGAALAIWDTITDPAQALSTAIFISALTGVQKAEVQRQAAAITKDIDKLVGMGVPQEKAASIVKDPDANSRLKRAEEAIVQEVSLNRDGMAKRVSEAEQARMKEREAAILAHTGVLELALKQANIIKGQPSTNGKYIVTVPKTEEELAAERAGKDAEAAAAIPTEKEVQMDKEGLIAFAQTIADAEVLKHMRDLQSRVIGAATLRSQKTESDVHKSIVFATDVNSKAVNIMQRNGGIIDLEVVQALSEEAAQTIEGFQKQGLSLEDAQAQQSAIPGVSLGSLLNIKQDFEKEAQAQGYDPAKTQTSIFNIKGNTPARSVILALKGEVQAKDALEDLIESDVRKNIEQNPAMLKQLATSIKAVDAEMSKLDPDHKPLLPSAEPDFQEVVEAFSSLAQANFALNHNALPLSDMAHAAIDYSVTKLADVQKMQNLVNAYNAAKEAGRLGDTTLESILEQSNADMGETFDSAMETGVRAALEDVKQAEALRDSYAEGNIAPPQPFAETSAEESVIGEPLPSPMQEQQESVNQETGEYTPLDATPVSQNDVAGKGLVDEACTVEEDGSVRGSVFTANLTPHPNAAEAHATDAWNPMSAPVHVIRREDGMMLTVSGQPNAQDTYTSVHVFEVTPETEADWVAEHSAGQNILNRTATAKDIETFFEYNPMTRAEAEQNGMVVKDFRGRPHPQYSSSFAMAPRTPDARASFTVARQSKEMRSILYTAKREVSRYSKVFRNAGKNSKQAIVESARISGILQGIAKRIPTRFRPRAKALTETVRIHGILARMLHDGKLSRSSKLDASFMEALRNELANVSEIADSETQAALDEALANPDSPIRKKVEAQLKKELYSKVARQYLVDANKLNTDPTKNPKTKAYERMAKSGVISEILGNEVVDAVFDVVDAELKKHEKLKLTSEEKTALRNKIAKRIRKNETRRAAKEISHRIAGMNFRISPEQRALLQAYERMAKSGVVTDSFTEEVWESIFNDVEAQEAFGDVKFTDAQKEAIRKQIKDAVTSDAYKQTAKMLADKMIGKDYKWPSASLKRKRALEKAIESGRPNQDLTPDDIAASQYNAKAIEQDKRTAMKQYAKRELAELNAIQAGKEKAHRKDKERIMRALHTIIKLGYIPQNTPLNKAEQKQLAEIAEDMLTEATIKQKADSAIEKQGDAFVRKLKDKILKNYAKSYAAQAVSAIKAENRAAETKFNQDKRNTIDALNRIIELGIVPEDTALTKEDTAQPHTLLTKAEVEASIQEALNKKEVEVYIDLRHELAVENAEKARSKKLENMLLSKHAKAYAKSKLKEIAEIAKQEKQYRTSERENLVRGLSRIVESGSIPANSTLPLKFQISLDVDVMERMEAELPKALARELKTNLPALNKEITQEIIAKHTGMQLGKVLHSLTESVVQSLDAAYKNHYLARLQNIFTSIEPYKNKSHLAPGKVSGDVYANVIRAKVFSQLSLEQMEEAQKNLINEIKSLEESGEASPEQQALLDEKRAEYADLSTFGALAERTTEEIVDAVEQLATIVSTGKSAWKEKLEQQAERIRAAQFAIQNHVGQVNASELADKEAKHAEGWRRFTSMLSTKHFFSIPQFLRWLSLIPGLKGTTESMLKQHAKATQVMRRLELDDIAAEKDFWKSIGINSDLEQAKFFEKALERKKTGINTSPQIEKRAVSITREAAKEWLALSEEERAARRQAMREQGKAPNQIVEEEAIPLIDAFLAEHKGKVRVSYEHNVGNVSEIIADKMVLLNIVLIAERPAYTAHMARVGYNEAVIAEIKNYLGEEMIAYGNFVREYLQNTGMREVYEERTGIRLPHDVTYWPGTFDQTLRLDDASSALEQEFAMQGRYGFLKSLKEHNLDPSLMLGAHQVFRHALNQHRHYVHLGQMSSDLRRLIRDKNTAKALKSYMGVVGFNSFKNHLDTLDGLPAAQSNGMRFLNMFVGACMGVRASILLAGNLVTIVKNFGSFINASRGSDMSFRQEAAQMLKDRFTSQPMSYSEMRHSDVIATRFRNISFYEDIRSKGSNSKFSRWGIISRGAFRGIEWADAVGNTLGAQALYNFTYNKEQKLNALRIKNGTQPLSEQEIREECWNAVRIMIDRASQPLSPSQKGSMAARDRNALTRSLVFMGSEALNKLANANLAAIEKGADASKISKACAYWQYLLPYSIYEQVIVAGAAILAGHAPGGDDDEAWKWWVGNSVAAVLGAGVLQGYPLIGDGVSHLARQLTGSKRFMPTGMMAELTGSDWDSIFRTLKDCQVVAKSMIDIAFEKEDKDTKRGAELAWKTLQMLRGICLIAGAFSGHSKIGTTTSEFLLALNTIGNAIRIPVQNAKNAKPEQRTIEEIMAEIEKMDLTSQPDALK